MDNRSIGFLVKRIYRKGRATTGKRRRYFLHERWPAQTVFLTGKLSQRFQVNKNGAGCSEKSGRHSPAYSDAPGGSLPSPFLIGGRH